MMPVDMRFSKRLSLWLRHQPAAAGLTLDAQGWTEVDAVLAALARAEMPVDWSTLLRLVEESDKQRFELSPDASRIRARQGHSVVVDLDWPETAPPVLLYHGTVKRAMPGILAEGLRPMRRHHVHLSGDIATATRVGARRGEAIILAIRAAALAEAGQVFLLTGNGVWLTDHVPPSYLARVDE
jgi:putative RNA 2'-phosphotransferase